jgi:hypothetical protein
MRGMSREERGTFFAQIRSEREEMQKEINKVTADVVRDFESRLARQTDVARVLTRVSPVASFVYANTDIGATGVRHEERLVNHLRTYQREFVRYVSEQTQGQGGFGWDRGGDDGDEYSVDELPSFEYRTDDLGVRLNARIIDVLLLVLFSIAFFMAAFISFLRSDVN